MSAPNNVPHPKPKIDKLTLIVYSAIGVLLLLFCLLLGAAMDYSVVSGKLDAGRIGKSVSYLLKHPARMFAALRNKGGYAPKTLLLGAMSIGIFVLYKYSEDAKRLHRRGTEHGSAKWGNRNEKASLADKGKPIRYPIKKYDAEHPDGVRMFDGNGDLCCVRIDNNIILTRDVRLSMNLLQHGLFFNALVIGGSGSQKTRGFAKPNVMQLNTSYVITDPKGEILTAEGELLRAAGYKVRIFNTIDMAHSDNYNPFHYVFDENGQMDEVKVKSMIETLFTSTKKLGEEENFWTQKGRDLLTAIVYLLFAESEYNAERYTEGEKKGMIIPETRDKTNLNFFAVTEKMRRMKYPPQGTQQPDGFFLTQNKGESDAEFEARREAAYLCDLDRDFLEVHRRRTSVGELAYDLYRDLRNAAEETGQSYISSANVKTFDFNLTGLKNLTCTDNIHLETIGDEKTALFIIISATDPTFRYLTAMMYSQMFNVLSNRANFHYKGRLPVHVRCIMDEFANCGEIPNFTGILSFVRGMNMSLSVIVQNMSQLKSRYKDTWEEIPGNCDSILFLGGKEESTLKSISEQLGKETIDVRGMNRTKGKSPTTSENNSILGRELLQMNEVGVLPTTDCILMMRGHNPFYDRKYVLEEHPNFRFTGDADEAYRFDLSKVHSVTIEEFAAEQKARLERLEARRQKEDAKKAAAKHSDKVPADRDFVGGFFHVRKETVIEQFIPTTFEEILEFSELTLPAGFASESYPDEKPVYGVMQEGPGSFDLGIASRPPREEYDDDEIPPPAVVNEDGSIEEPDAADEVPERVCYGTRLPEEPESFDDLSVLTDVRFTGMFSESYPDEAKIGTEPDFGQIHPDEIPFDNMYD